MGPGKGTYSIPSIPAEPDGTEPKRVYKRSPLPLRRGEAPYEAGPALSSFPNGRNPDPTSSHCPVSANEGRIEQASDPYPGLPESPVGAASEAEPWNKNFLILLQAVVMPSHQ